MVNGVPGICGCEVGTVGERVLLGYVFHNEKVSRGRASLGIFED